MTKAARNRLLLERVLFTAVPLLLLIVFYARWLFTAAPKEPLSIVMATVATFLFALLGIRFIPQWMEAWSLGPLSPVRPIDGKRSARRDLQHPFLSIVLALIAFRVLLFILAYLLVLARDGYSGGVFDTLGVWNMLGSDSRHYLHIAEFGYTNTGDDRLLIVFFPLYPLLVRAFRYVFQNYFVSGLFVSNLCAVFAGYLLYEVALLDTDKRTARRTLRYLCILPASFLFSAPLSDSLFLLLSLACVWFSRKRKYLLAGLMGMLAAFTRAPGVLLAVPMCFELVGDIVREFPKNRHHSKWAVRVLGRVCCVLLVGAGFVCYLLLNDAVTGSPTTFLQYQSEHWHQRLGWFFATAGTQSESLVKALASGSRETAFGLWLPNLVYTTGALALVIAAQKRLRASNVAYFIAYYLVTMGATWLLSAPRYLTACYPLALALGQLTRKRWADLLATSLCLLGFAYYLYAFVNQWYVY